ncbi:hypothetical protein ACLMJK_000385 [Lecanora helva]
METRGAATIPKSNAELREKCDAAEDPAVGEALGDVELVGEAAPVPDVVAPAVVVAGVELIVPLDDAVAEDDADDEVIELDEPFPLA